MNIQKHVGEYFTYQLCRTNRPCTYRQVKTKQQIMAEFHGHNPYILHSFFSPKQRRPNQAIILTVGYLVNIGFSKTFSQLMHGWNCFSGDGICTNILPRFFSINLLLLTLPMSCLFTLGIQTQLSCDTFLR